MTDDQTRLQLYEGAEPDFEEDLPRDAVSEAQGRASTYGKEFDADAEEFITRAGGTVVEHHVKVLGFPMDFLIRGRNGAEFYVDAHGTPDPVPTSKSGMRRTDTMLKFGFKALCLKKEACPRGLILLTSHLPERGASAFYLSKLQDALFDAVATIGDPDGLRRLEQYLTSEPHLDEPLPAAWRLGSQGTFDLGWEWGDDDDA